MKGIVRRRDRARQDLVDIFRYLATKASIRTARRFLVQTETTLGQLASMPRMGTRFEPEHLAFPEIRFFPITRFKNYLVFYSPIAHGIDIVRILHGASDISRILANDFGVDKGYDQGVTD